MSKQAVRSVPAQPAKSAAKATNVAGLEPLIAQSATEPMVAPSPPLSVAVPGEGDIRRLAYLKWEAAGRPEGCDVLFWIQAERELSRGT
jgi:hypothetical protein